MANFKCGGSSSCPSELTLDQIREKRCLLPSETIDYVKDQISYEEFFLRYLLPNKPCILTPQVTQLWKSRAEWVTHEGKPNFEFLEKTFGKVSVPVAVCDKEEFCSHPKIQKKFDDYLDYWQKYISSNYDKSMQCLYLKDWHFTRDFPEYMAYTTPMYFQSDWLNEYWDSQENQDDDDYRFVYMGPKGSWTSFHADVFHSYSWSANICGQKRWLLFPPGEENHLRDKFGSLPFDVTSNDLLDPSLYPNAGNLTKQYEVVQNPGEIIFVPSGWHHQVWNMKDTISINHNWSNGCCIDLNWGFLKRSLTDVQKEISDCSEMEGWYQQCQLILKSLTGINYEEFFHLCKTIAKNRYQQLEKSRETKNSGASRDKNIPTFKMEADCEEFSREIGQSVFSSNSHFMPVISNHCHLRFDLHRLKDILGDMLQDKEFALKDEVDNFLKEVEFL